MRVALIAGFVAITVGSAACGGGGDAATVPQAPSTATPAITATLPASVSPRAPAAPTATAIAPSVTASAQRAAAPDASPTRAPAPTSPAAPPPAAEQSITIVAKNVKFSPGSLVAKAGGVVHLVLDNQDAGVQHDIVLYDASGAVAGATDAATGPTMRTLVVTLGPPQRYTFKCSVHPQTMNGALSAQ